MGTDGPTAPSNLNQLQLRGVIRLTVLLVSLALYVMLTVSVSIRMDGRVEIDMKHEGFDTILKETLMKQEMKGDGKKMKPGRHEPPTTHGSLRIKHRSRHDRADSNASATSFASTSRRSRISDTPKSDVVNATELNLAASHSIPNPSPLQPAEHPHAGARYPNGTFGYVADVTASRRRIAQRYRMDSNGSSISSRIPSDYMPFSSQAQLSQVCGALPMEGRERRGWQILKRVNVHTKQHGNMDSISLPLASREKVASVGATGSGATAEIPQRRILCAVYTHEKNHDRIDGITDTWGWRCDGFFAASTKTVLPSSQEPGAGAAIDLPHLGPEEYGNMGQKTKSIVAYMYDNFLDYDYFYLAGDDTHLIVENLRRYISVVESDILANLTGEDPSTKALPSELPLYMGMRIYHGKVEFHHGGSGYVLNREALRRVVSVGFDPKSDKRCDLLAQTSAEDRFMGRCIRRLGIRPVDSSDSVGRQRFHAMHPEFVERFPGVDRDANVVIGTKKRADRTDYWWQAVYEYWAKNNKSPGWKTGVDLVSPESISFHHMRGINAMKRHHALLYPTSCPIGSPLGDEMRNHTMHTRSSDI
jgi:Fringe-like